MRRFALGSRVSRFLAPVACLIADSNLAMSSSTPRTISSTPTSVESSYRPLTTLFVPPTACSASIRTGATFVTGLIEIFQQPVHNDEFSAYISACYPTEALDIEFTYSPGICPSGFTTAYSTVSNSVTSAQCCPQYGTSSTSEINTAELICNRGFGTWRDDFATVGVPTETKTRSCFRKYTTSTSIDCFISDNNAACAQTIVGPGVDESLAVYVRYESKDLSLFPKDYTPDGALVGITTQTLELQTTTTSLFSASAGSGPKDSAASPTSTSLQLTETPRSSAVLSAGMKAGIAVGVIIGVCGLLGLGMLFLWRRKHQRKAQAHELPNTDLPEFVAVAKSKPHMTESRTSSDVKPTYAYHHVGVIGELDGANQSPGLQELPAIPRLSYAHEQQDESSRPAPISLQTDSQKLKEPHDHKPKPQDQANFTNEPGFNHESSTVESTESSQNIRTSRPADVETTAKPSFEHKLQAEFLSSSSSRLQSDIPPSALPKPQVDMTAADWELLYLESEERRLRERRETILRSHDT